MKIYYLSIVTCFILACSGCVQDADLDTTGLIDTPPINDIIAEQIPEDSSSSNLNLNDNKEVQEEPEVISEEMGIDNLPSYPEGPYSLDLFNVLPNMSFYDPWNNEWFNLSELYKHEKHKSFILVSSAGWCGPCLMEAAALISVYEKYNNDGLEIIYTLGNTNILGDVPFDTSAGDVNSDDFFSDITFMENWRFMTQEEAQKILNYKIYADPNREFIKFLPNHAWPLSMLVTTKDMGIRLIEEGYWSALMENKIMLVLYNDIPEIPFR